MGIKEDFEKWFADRFKGALDFDEEAEDGDAVAAISRIVGLEAFEAGQVALAGRIAELEAERDALRKDAERYRWLRDQWGYLCVGEGVIELEGKFNPMDGFLDEAIDAAIAAKEPK